MGTPGPALETWMRFTERAGGSGMITSNSMGFPGLKTENWAGSMVSVAFSNPDEGATGPSLLGTGA